MTNSKATKKALFSSFVSLLLCFTMLMGATFAWFTDNVSSTGNRIQAGTLKVDLEVRNADGTYSSVRDMADPIFNYDRWEPGYTQVKTLKIENEGNLALKYQLNVTAENDGCILADVIDVYMCFGESTATSAADLADTSKWWKCGTLAEMMAKEEGFTQGKLLPADATYEGELLGYNGVAIGDITASIALHMQETAGNEYQGLDLGNIDINLLATQFTYEEDSFGDQYDEDSEYPAVAQTIKVEGSDKAAVLAAIENANPGDIIRLTEDTTIAGYAATNKLTIDKAIVLDLNGKTITTECGWGGIDAKGGCSIINGTINHTGNTAAIKAFQVEKIENVTINVTETAGKTKGGIVVQEGSGCYVGSIKNVTITGATNGIETYRCGERTDLAIGYMENVKIDAIDTGISLSAPVGQVVNCEIEGDKIGINMYLYGPYSVSIDLVNSTVTGDTGIYAHDEVGKTNPGSLTLTYDADTQINGEITQEFEDEVKSRVSIS